MPGILNYLPLIIMVIAVSGCITGMIPEEPVVCEEGETLLCGSDIGICKPGIRACVNGEWGECVGSVGPATEVCANGLDDDCDGSVDEDCGECREGQTRACGTSVGECETGIQTCINRTWGDCEGEVMPEPEVCDGLDNDCDGVADETGCPENESIYMEGQTRSVSIGETSYQVTLVGVSDTDTVIVTVDGEIREISEGEDIIVFGLGIYIVRVFYLPKETQTSWAKLLFF